MRVLSAVIAVLGGCYSPGVEDCQFRCGMAMDCPDGTACENGVCRTGEASSDCPDVSNACAPSTPQNPASCTDRFALEGGGCGVTCGGGSGGNENSSSEAESACRNAGWQLGVLDSTSKLDAVPSSSNSYWVGARRNGVWSWLGGDVVANSAWRSGTAPTGGEDCAVLTGSSRRLDNNINCGDTERYICTWPQR